MRQKPQPLWGTGLQTPSQNQKESVVIKKNE